MTTPQMEKVDATIAELWGDPDAVGLVWSEFYMKTKLRADGQLVGADGTTTGTEVLLDMLASPKFKTERELFSKLSPAKEKSEKDDDEEPQPRPKNRLEEVEALIGRPLNGHAALAIARQELAEKEAREKAQRKSPDLALPDGFDSLSGRDQLEAIRRKEVDPDRRARKTVARKLSAEEFQKLSGTAQLRYARESERGD